MTASLTSLIRHGTGRVSDDRGAIETALGHCFGEPDLLEQALTHPSVPGAPHYERLEFLGDRVLGLLVADVLLLTHPDWPEGDLALRYNELVRRDSLAEVMLRTGLAGHIRLSRGEKSSGGHAKPAILADVCEALIGALYLDGGLEAARNFIEDHWADLFASPATQEKDAKTRLQELVQGRGVSHPVYEDVGREGLDHAPIFTVAAVLEDGTRAEGTGSSKREAEQAAAAALIDLLEDRP
jgi:ribonuclease-3